MLNDVDAIILCTGYIYDFPFLNGVLDDVDLSGRFIGPLYLNMFYPADPTLIFLGLPRFTIHFASIHLQSIYCAKILSGELELPSPAQIKQDIAEGHCVLQKNPSDLDDYHNSVFDYFSQLCDLTGQPHLDWKGFLEAVNDRKREYQQDYRQYPFTYDLKK